MEFNIGMLIIFFAAAVVVLLAVVFGFLRSKSDEPIQKKSSFAGEVLETSLARNKYLIAGTLKIKTDKGEVVKGEYQGLSANDANALNVKKGDKVEVLGYWYSDFWITNISAC